VSPFDNRLSKATDDHLLGVLERLRQANYQFVTPTPATHALVRRRRPARESSLLTDIFGWVRPFQASQLDAGLLQVMQGGNLVEEIDGGLQSRLRVSVVRGRYFLHSSPTTDEAAVFLGPDSYRFAALLARTVGAEEAPARVLDIGTGAGVGAIILQDLAPRAEVFGSDVNPAALRLARLAGVHAGMAVRWLSACGLPGAPARFDLITANPPYVADVGGQTYRDGGDDFGTSLGLSWVREGLSRLEPRGRFILYTGAPMIEGTDILRLALEQICADQDFSMQYEELDPDVFGGMLRQPAYGEVERIAAVGAVIRSC
jgi:SAM-dependent methyltransferase